MAGEQLNHSGHSERYKANRLYTTAGALALTATLAMSCNACIDAKTTGDPLYSIKEAYGKATEHGLSIDTSGPAMKRVNRSLALIASRESTYTGPNMTLIDNGPDLEASSGYQYCLDQARQCGFHAIDARPYIDDIDRASTVNDVEAIMKLYFKQYQIDFSIPQESENARFDFNDTIPLDIGSVVVSDFKQASGELLARFSIKPVELIEFSGMKQIKLIQGFKDGNFSYPSPSQGIDYISLAYLEDASRDWAPDGQLAEFIDTRINGQFGAINDSAYLKAGGYNTKELNVGYVAHYDKTDFYKDNLSGIRPYGYIFSGNNRLKNGSKYLMARLEEGVPGITRYLAAISTLSPNYPEQ